ncbi:MAG TPA: hypothetical protein DCL54_10155 [Alphaproteobacteria bacterium]|nr:hypothetical protein [Alphaproteobacteria bacterium]HAJ46929.1 hypothetical protein [Alphaproteobacteria bacterium]
MTQNPKYVLSETLVGEPDDIADRVRRAEAAILAMRMDFVAWASDDIQVMKTLCAQAAQSGGETPLARDAIRRIAHNIKGQGGSFDCAEVSAIAHDLCEYLRAASGAGWVASATEMVSRLNDSLDAARPSESKTLKQI